MDRKRFVISLTFLFLAVVAFSGTAAAAGVHNNRTNTTYSTIQEAIGNATDNDTLIVDEGTYNETIQIRKGNLRLIANGNVTINCNTTSISTMCIFSDNVYVEGFRFVGDLSAIRISYSKNVTIINNEFIGVRFGVAIEHGTNNKIINNMFNGCTHCGVAIVNSKSNIIQGNQFIGSRYSAILLGNTTNNTIKDNIIRGSLWDGITLAYSLNNTITANNITGGRRGLTAFASKMNKISGNNISNVKECGIYTEYSPENIIDQVTIQGTHNRRLDTGTQRYALLIRGPAIGPESVEEMADFLYGLGYNVWKLIEPKREEVFTALSGLAEIVRPEDTCTIYINAHGCNPSWNGSLYAFSVADGLIYNYELEKLVRGIASQNKILILDSCHSGGVAIKDYNDTTSFFDTNTTIITATGVETVAFGPELAEDIIDAFSDPMTDANKDGQIDLAELYYAAAIRCIPVEMPRFYENTTAQITWEFKPRILNLTVNPTTGAAPLDITVEATIINSGNMPGEYTATLYINQKPVATQKIIINPQQTERITFNYTLNATGTYNVTIDNLTPVTVTVFKPADIKFTVTPTSGLPPLTVTVTATLTNTGNIPGNYTVEVKINGVTVHTKTISLGAGATTNLTFKHTLYEPGTYNISINELEPITVTVLKPAQIILEELVIRWVVKEAPVPVEISCKLTNIGDIDGNYTLTVYVNGKPVAVKTVTLNAHETKTITFNYTLNEPGTYNITVNEMKGTTITVYRPANITLSNLTITPRAGTAPLTIKISCTLTNNGDVPGDYTAELKVNGVTVQTQTVIIPAGQTVTVEFNWTLQAGTYNVTIGNLTPVTVTVASAIKLSDLVAASKSVKSYYERYGKLPTSITIVGQKYTMAQLLYLLAKATVNINAGNLNPIMPKIVAAPISSSGSYRHGRLYKSSYVQVANNILNYMNSYGRAPNYATTTLGKIPFTRLVYIYSKIITYYGTYKRLPMHVTI